MAMGCNLDAVSGNSVVDELAKRQSDNAQWHDDSPDLIVFRCKLVQTLLYDVVPV